MSDSTASRLRNDILSGITKPGTLLAESSVARQLGVSRVPVREALFTLEREGLVQFSPTGRAFVKDLTPKDFEELLQLRLILEPVAARLAAPLLKHDCAALLKNIAATRRTKTVLEVTRLDLEFHELILLASGNARLHRMWCGFRSELELWLGRLHRAHQRQTSETREQTVRAHEAVVACFKNETPIACERLMRIHIQGWREWLPGQDDLEPS